MITIIMENQEVGIIARKRSEIINEIHKPRFRHPNLNSPKYFV